MFPRLIPRYALQEANSSSERDHKKPISLPLKRRNWHLMSLRHGSTIFNAGAFMDLVDGLREEQGFDLDRPAVCYWLRTRSEPSSRRLFADTFHEQLEVTHPLEASHLRTVISGTLEVLVQHAPPEFCKELVPRLVNLARSILQKQITRAQEIFKRVSAIENFFSASFSRNVFVNIKEIFSKIGEDSLNACEETDERLIQFVKAFDPGSLLAATLQQITDRQGWKFDDLVLLGLSLDEPLDASFIKVLQPAISSLDLSRWSGDQELTAACVTLARCANATADSIIRKEVIDKLTEAWIQLAQRPVQYSATLSAIIQTLTGGHIVEPAAAFYRWWVEVVEKTQGQLPEEISESAIWLAWQLPVKHQQGLSEVKAKLLML